MSEPMAEAILARRDALFEKLERVRECQAGLAAQTKEIQQALLDCVAASRLFGVDVGMPPERQLIAAGSVREFVSQMLAASPDGVKAKEIMDHYELQMGVRLHPKTIGMTLWRLKVDGQATREGRQWHLAPVSQQQTKIA